MLAKDETIKHPTILDGYQDLDFYASLARDQKRDRFSFMSASFWMT